MNLSIYIYKHTDKDKVEIVNANVYTNTDYR